MKVAGRKLRHRSAPTGAGPNALRPGGAHEIQKRNGAFMRPHRGAAVFG